MIKLQNQKTNLISKTRKPAFYYTHTHTHVVLKGQKNKNNNVQNTSSVYVAKLGNEYSNNIYKNATDYANNEITNVTLNIILNKILRREIPKWNGSSCGAFFQKRLCPFWNPYEFLPTRVPPFGIPTKGAALRTRSSVRGTNIAILVALILVLPRALITRRYVVI